MKIKNVYLDALHVFDGSKTISKNVDRDTFLTRKTSEIVWFCKCNQVNNFGAIFEKTKSNISREKSLDEFKKVILKNYQTLFLFLAKRSVIFFLF